MYKFIFLSKKSCISCNYLRCPDDALCSANKWTNSRISLRAVDDGDHKIYGRGQMVGGLAIMGGGGERGGRGLFINGGRGSFNNGWKGVFQ